MWVIIYQVTQQWTASGYFPFRELNRTVLQIVPYMFLKENKFKEEVCFLDNFHRMPRTFQNVSDAANTTPLEL